MGVRGNVRRSSDGHIIHANVDTDVIISEEPEYGSTQKPEEMYAVIEHFALGAVVLSYRLTGSYHLMSSCRVHSATCKPGRDVRRHQALCAGCAADLLLFLTPDVHFHLLALQWQHAKTGGDECRHRAFCAGCATLH
jgi:hypothetical protein